MMEFMWSHNHIFLEGLSYGVDPATFMLSDVLVLLRKPRPPSVHWTLSALCPSAEARRDRPAERFCPAVNPGPGPEPVLFQICWRSSEPYPPPGRNNLNRFCLRFNAGQKQHVSNDIHYSSVSFQSGFDQNMIYSWASYTEKKNAGSQRMSAADWKALVLPNNQEITLWYSLNMHLLKCRA